MSARIEYFSDQPEKILAAKTPRSKRIGLGQVFTPHSIARCMAQWVSARKKPVNILDPALGLGIFMRVILEENGEYSGAMTGYEVDEPTAMAAEELFHDHGYAQLKVRHEDFLAAGWADQYDAILCNPPYRKFRGLPDKERWAAAVRENCGITVSRSANLYIYFLLKLLYQLADGGRAAVILPYEFLNADYGIPVKQALLDQGVLRMVLILGKNLVPFDDVITTACILCLERSQPESPAEMVYIQSSEDLVRITEQFKSESQSIHAAVGSVRQAPAAHQKWHITSLPARFNNSAAFVPLATFGKVMRGIATGDNDFFVLKEAERQEFDLDETSLLGCLAKAGYAPGITFSDGDFCALKASGKPVWLLNLAGRESQPAVRRAIERGIQNGSNRRFLTRKRSPWYALEERPPAPLLATTFSRDGIRWVRNSAGVRNLTAFHGFYPHPGVNLDLLHAYLVTPLAREILSQNHREYGNGLHKFEPNDLNQALVMDIRQLPYHVQDQVLNAYRSLDSSDRAGTAISRGLAELNQIFGDFFAG